MIAAFEAERDFLFPPTRTRLTDRTGMAGVQFDNLRRCCGEGVTIYDLGMHAP